MANEVALKIALEGAQVVVDGVVSVEKGLDKLNGSADTAGVSMGKLTGSIDAVTGAIPKLTGATNNWQLNMKGVDAAIKSTAASSVELSQATQKILDRYDPLGTKLRSLTSDMALLRREMGDSASDAAMKSFQGLEKDIEKTQALMVSAGVAGSEGFTKTAAAADKTMFSTAGAKRELMVLGHEAMSGNFSKMPGSFMVLAERMDLTAMLMSPVTLGVIGIGIAAVATAVHIYKMSSEVDEFNKSLILTGNYAGQTRDSIAAMAAGIQSSATGGVGKATEMLNALAATGHFTGGELEAVGQTALKFSQLSGESSDKVIKQFDGMRNGVADWAAKSNESYHFLTAAQYEEIAVLEKQGRSQEAVMETMRLMNSSLDEQKKHLGVWASIVDGASISWDSLNASMRKTIFPTLGEEVEKESKALTQLIENQKKAKLNGGYDAASDAVWAAEIAAQRHKLAAIVAKSNAEEIAAGQKQSLDLSAQRGVAAQREIDQLLMGQRDKETIRADEEKSIRANFDRINKDAKAHGDAAVYTDDEITLAISKNNEKFVDRAKVASDAGRVLAASFDAANEKALQELSTGEKLTAADQFRIAGLKSIEELMRKKKTTLDEVVDLESKMNDVEMNIAAATAFTESTKATEKAIADMASAGDKMLTSLDDQIKKQTESNDQMGLTKAQIDALKSTRMLDSAASDEQLASNMRVAAAFAGPLHDAYLQYATDLDQAAAKKRVLAGLEATAGDKQRMIDAGKEAEKAAKKAEDAWAASSKSIGDGLYNAIAEGGDSALKKLLKDAREWFARLVLSPIISPIAAFGASLLNPTAASAAQGGTSALTNFSAAQTLKGLYDTITGGFTAAATSIADMGVSLGGKLIDMGAEKIGTKLMELSTNPGTVGALSTAGYALAGVTLGSMIAGDKVVLGMSGTTTSAIGAAIGTAILPGIGTLIGGLAGGVFSAAFGSGATQVREQGTRGTFGGSGFAGSNYANMHQDGGWFTSDNNWTQTSAIDGGTLKAWSDAFVGVKSAVASTATSLGLSTDLITSYSKYIDLAAGSSKETITAMFTGMADEMALAVAPSLSRMIKEGETASVTLSRLSTSLATTNTWLSMLGDQLIGVSLSGADAASKLADVFGGLDKFTASAKSFYDLYYTDTERANQSVVDMSKALALVNIVLPDSKASFKDLTKTLDLTTDYGRQAYAVLLTIAPEYAATADTIAKLAGDATTSLVKLFTVAGNVDYAGLGKALTSANTETIVATLNHVFVDLTGRIKTLVDGIATERVAISSAAAQINGPKDISYAGLQSDIAAIKAKSGLPSDAGVLAANTALATANVAAAAAQKLVTDTSSGVSASQTALTTMSTYYQGKANELHSIAASYGLTVNSGKSANNLANDAYNYDPTTNKLNDFNSLGYSTNTTTTSSLLFGSSSSSSSTLANAPAFRAANYGPGGIVDLLNGGNAALAQAAQNIVAAQATLSAATAALPTALTNQAAAAAAAKKASIDYAASIQAYVVEASKSVPALSKLREETVAYYQAQKDLASLMATSATNLRSAVATTRSGQLDSTQSLSQRQNDFASAYSLALATSGATQAGYADKLTAALPDLSTALKDSAKSQVDWELATGKLFAQSENVAKLLDANAPVDYQAQSLGLLNSIDSTLAALDDSTSAITRAISAGSDLTAAGLRGIITQLGGVPAFAGGGYHSGGLRLVGENGPELEVTGPSQIYNAAQLRSLRSGGQGGSESTDAEIRQLREENKAQARALVELTARLAKTNDMLLKIFDSWDVEGMPQTRAIA